MPAKNFDNIKLPLIRRTLAHAASLCRPDSGDDACLAWTAPLLLAAEFRPPAVPLVTVDPYTSCWSLSDKLSADWPRHWTGKVHAMCGFVRVDGKPLRFMGAAPEVKDEATQDSLEVRATQTVYRFHAGGVSLNVTFTAPLLLDDLDLASRPANYVTFDVASADGKPHAVQLYFDATGEWAVNRPQQQVEWGRAAVDGMDALKIGSRDQRVLATKGDDVRIDWGYLYLAVPRGAARTAAADDKSARAAFAASGAALSVDDAQMPRAANDRWPVLSAVFDLRRQRADPPPFDRGLRRSLLGRVFRGKAARPGGGAIRKCRPKRCSPRPNAITRKSFAAATSSTSSLPPRPRAPVPSNTPNCASWPIGKPSRPTNWSRALAAGPCSSRRRISAMARSAPST